MDNKRRNFLIAGLSLGFSGLVSLLLGREKTLSASDVSVSEAKDINHIQKDTIADQTKNTLKGTVSASLGINLATIAYWSAERPFVDLMKMATKFDNPDARAEGYTFDSNGWLTYIPPNKIFNPIILGFPSDGNPIQNPQEFTKTGRYVLLYDGAPAIYQTGAIADENVIKFGYGDHISIVSQAPNRIVFDMDFSLTGWYQLNLEFYSLNPANPIKNIRIVPIEKESTYLTNPWTDDFLALWANTKCIRHMTYQKINNSNIESWNQRSLPSHQSWEDVPLEILIDLCNRLNVDGWFCIAHKANDDYVTQFSTLLKNTLVPKAYIEYSNEVWNWSFDQAQYALQKFYELNLTGIEAGGHLEFYAYRTMQIMGIVDTVYGQQRASKVVRVAAGQSANSGLVGGMLGYQNFYQSVDVLATAPYLTLNVDGNNLATYQNWSGVDILNYLQTTAMNEVIGWMQSNKTVADTYNLPLIAYEGGQHVSLYGAARNNTALLQATYDANGSPQMEAIYTTYLNAWASNGGGLFCHYDSTNKWSIYGCWGLLQSPYQALETSPKYQAVAKWANARGQKMRLK